MSNLEYEYLDTVKKLDKMFQKNEQEISFDNKCKKTLNENSREDDLYQEIYSKFNENYNEIVEEFTQTIINYENKRVKNAYYFGFVFCILSLSLAF